MIPFHEINYLTEAENYAEMLKKKWLAQKILRVLSHVHLKNIHSNPKLLNSTCKEKISENL